MHSVRIIIAGILSGALFASAGSLKADDALIRSIMLMKISIAIIEKCSIADAGYHRELRETLELAESYAAPEEVSGTSLAVEGMALSCSKDSIHVKRVMRGFAKYQAR